MSTIKFFAYGDTRSRADEHRKIADAMARTADGHLFVLHSGDFVADGRKYGLWLSEFFAPATALLAKLPLYPVAGNHERTSDLYRAYFDAPEPRWYYGVTVGPVHITTIDFYKETLDGPNWRETPQGKFLLSEFARPHDTPWRVAMLHTPLYSRGPHGQLDAAGRPKEKPMRFAREVLEPLLRQAGYQLVLSGHDHIYERSVKDGLTMVTTGGGGAPNYVLGEEKQNPYSQVAVSCTHYCDLTVSAGRLTAKAIDGDGQVIDRFTLTR